jgi:outer membrane murein-binding lipoprotein Lpp
MKLVIIAVCAVLGFSGKAKQQKFSLNVSDLA